MYAAHHATNNMVHLSSLSMLEKALRINNRIEINNVSCHKLIFKKPTPKPKLSP